MIPEHRLFHLFDQVKKYQTSNCRWHNTTKTPSLYTDHVCPRDTFPTTPVLQINDHSDEVLFAQFCNNGSRLATTSKDGSIRIYDIPTFKCTEIPKAHHNLVAYISWSPDDSRIVSCSMDREAKVWDANVSASSVIGPPPIFALLSYR